MGMPHEAVIGVALIVREDQDDVGRFGPGSGCEKKEDEKDMFFMDKWLVVSIRIETPSLGFMLDRRRRSIY